MFTVLKELKGKLKIFSKDPKAVKSGKADFKKHQGEFLGMINEILNLKKFPLLNNSDIKKCYTILNKEDKSEKYVSIDLIITNDDKLYMLIYEIPYSCW